MVESKRPFIAAKPSPAVIRLAQLFTRFSLSLNNKMFVAEEDVDILRRLPRDAGLLLTPNHADEVDPQVVLELSRRSGRRFIVMCNREAFDELGGLAGWGLQRLGLFSVERGAHDAPAKDYSIQTIERGNDLLVIFPEGEIFYLNEMVQPFHTGAVELAMQAIARRREVLAQFNAMIVPVAIKYTYVGPIEQILRQRIGRLEERLNIEANHSAPFDHRLRVILRALVAQEEQSHHITVTTGNQHIQLTQEVAAVRRALLDQIEQKYQAKYNEHRATIDQSWELSAKLREMLISGAQNQTEIRQDLSALHEVAHMVSWQPKYFAHSSSFDRYAEVVLKLEREYYHIKRPKQMGKRHVHVKVGPPLDLGLHFEAYQTSAQTVRSQVTQTLHDTIQSMIDELTRRIHGN